MALRDLNEVLAALRATESLPGDRWVHMDQVRYLLRYIEFLEGEVGDMLHTPKPGLKQAINAFKKEST